MPENKYDSYFVKEPLLDKGGFYPVVLTNGARDFEGAGFSLRIHYITEPGLLVHEAHSHDFEQFYFFLSSDFSNTRDFDAVIEFSLGEEEELHLITAPTAIHVPIGMVHGPMNFKTVNRPFIFIDTLLSAEYTVK